MDSKKKRYSEEIKRIRQLSAINKVLKKGDVENAFLNNADKETEISKDTAVERMLEELQADKSEKRDLELIDNLVSEVSASSKPAVHKAVKATVKIAKSKIKTAPKAKKQSKKKR